MADKIKSEEDGMDGMEGDSDTEFGKHFFFVA